MIIGRRDIWVEANDFAPIMWVDAIRFICLDTSTFQVEIFT